MMPRKPRLARPSGICGRESSFSVLNMVFLSHAGQAGQARWEAP
jgi:hypothetical protein